MKRTVLYDHHVRLNAKMTDFHGWEMPLYYTSILEEHRVVRESFGLFDISHMGQVLVTGPDALSCLNELVVSDLTQVSVGRSAYTMLLNEQGGILDDILVYRLGAQEFLIIVNCATRESDVAWLQQCRRGTVEIVDISDGRAILAVQGPRACRVLEQTLDAKVTGLGRMDVAPIRTMGPDACLARTGYTGGDGFEAFLPTRHAQRLWETLVALAPAVDAAPAGLGARDTLRLEAGLRLYGTDMDATTTPLEAGLGWTVALHKPSFIGKEALVRQQQAGLPRRFIGFELPRGPVPRGGSELFAEGCHVGRITSGTFSLMLHKPIGMGYVDAAFAKPGTELSVTVRHQRYAGRVVRLPFWKPEPKPPAALTGASTTTER